MVSITDSLFTIRVHRNSIEGLQKIQQQRGINRNRLVNEAIAFYLAHQPELRPNSEKAPA